MDDTVARIVGNLETDTPVSLSFLRDLETLLDYTCRTDDPIDLENLYTDLSSRNVSPTSLPNLISSGMDSSMGVNTSILAAKVYLLLLSAPNSPVFTLFSPMHFLGLLRAIRLAIKNPSLVSKEGSVQQSRKKKRGRNAGGKKSRVDTAAEDMEIDGREGGLDVKELFSVLQRLEVVLGLVHLDRFPDCLKALVQTVSDMPKMAVEFQENFGDLGRLCELCERILGEALKPEHGDQGESATEILKALTPPILSSKSQARSFSMGFVLGRMVRTAASSSGIKEKLANLPKYLVVNAPERAEGRALAVESIMDIVKCLDTEDQVRFAEYVVNMSQGKAHLRLLSVDLILNFTTSSSGPSGFGVVDDGVERPLGLRLLETLIDRCSDSAALIRARALTNLAQVLGTLSGNVKNRLVLKEALGYGNEGRCKMNDILKRRCMDEKAAVRKAALTLLSKLSAVLGGNLDEELLKTVGMACSDPLVSIRKVGVSTLSEVFRTYSSSVVTREWLHSVPRLANDNETSIQEDSENLFLELVIDRVSKVANYNKSVHHVTKSKGDCMDMGDDFPEETLELLKEICDGDVSPWVKKICSSLGKKKKLKPVIAVALRNIISTSESGWLSQNRPIEKWTAPPGAWFLLSEVSAFLSKAIDWQFLHHHWLLLDKCEPIGERISPLEQGDANGETLDVENNSVAWVGDRVFLLQTISNVSVELPPEPAAELAHNILERLEGFNMHSTEVNAHVKALRTLCIRKARNTEEADSIVLKWADQLLSKASQALDLYMSKISGNSEDCGFLTPPTNTRSRIPKSVSKLSKPANTAIYTIGSLVIVCPSVNLKSIVPVIHTIITSGNSDPKSSKLPRPAAPLKQTAPSLYIQAWLTMGKICLADGKLAKRYIPLFVQELEKSDSAALRNNIVVMMTDFCVRYTALVDCYMSKITKCLRDPCELVRRQTFILLSRLLQRDYVKWRGVLFLRFLLCLVDDSEKISKLADFLFGNILKAKAPLLAYNSFVEAVFVLNDCNAHTGRGNPNNSRSESRLFSIRGNDEKSRSKRMHIYVTLLKQMAPEHLLATFAKVCAEILAAASDGMLSLDDSTSQSVLRDAFFILSSKEIRILPNRGSATDGADMEEDGENNAGTSKGRAITQGVRKGLIQNTIPIFIELKRLLESKNSPLMGSLMDCLRIILKEYKNDIDDMLVADQQLRKELIYDMEKYESMKATTKAAEAVATMHRSESYHSPNILREQNTNTVKSKLPDKLKSNSKVASAVGDAVAAATARSVLRDVTNGLASPLSAMGVPKLKSQTKGTVGGASGKSRPNEVIQSLRRQFFVSDKENC